MNLDDKNQIIDELLMNLETLINENIDLKKEVIILNKRLCKGNKSSFAKNYLRMNIQKLEKDLENYKNETDTILNKYLI